MAENEDVTNKDLAKLILVYQWLYSTDKPTRPVSSLTTKLKKKFAVIMSNQKEMFMKNVRYQDEIYAQAWAKTMSDNDDKLVSLGLMIGRVVETIDDKVLAKYAGLKVFEKAIDSYYFAKNSHLDDADLEEQATILVDSILEGFDGKKKDMKVKRMLFNVNNNRIIEGKNAWKGKSNG